MTGHGGGGGVTGSSGTWTWPCATIIWSYHSFPTSKTLAPRYRVSDRSISSVTFDIEDLESSISNPRSISTFFTFDIVYRYRRCSISNDTRPYSISKVKNRLDRRSKTGLSISKFCHLDIEHNYSISCFDIVYDIEGLYHVRYRI